MTATVDLVEQQTTALDLADRGLHVFPVDHPILARCAGAHPRAESCDGKRGKHPACAWSKASSTDRNEVGRMFGRGPRNIGIDCGRSGLLVLDEDTPGGIARLCSTFGVDLPPTFSVTTGRGQHRYFRQPETLPYGNGLGRIGGYGVDVRGGGGYVVGPGSVHETGRVYSIADPSAVAPVPSWLADALRPPEQPRQRPSMHVEGRSSDRAVVGALQVLLDAAEGGRNNALNWAAYRLFQRVRDGRLDEQLALDLLADAAAAVGLPATEARATIGSARRAALGK